MNTKKTILLTAISMLLSLITLAQVDEIWGVTKTGGDTLGTIYKINTDGSGFGIMHQFEYLSGNRYNANMIDYGGLTLAGGKMYGLTSIGGNHGFGTLFSYDTITHVQTKIIDFDNNEYAPGKYPSGNLLLASNGLLYGVATGGGYYGLGVLFSFDPVTNAYTKLFDFAGAGGGTGPQGGLCVGPAGRLYGVCGLGGINNKGTIFYWDYNTLTFQRIFNFNDTTSGSSPIGPLVMAPNGMLYGNTEGFNQFDQHGGYFMFNVGTGTLTTIHDFDLDAPGFADGISPQTGLTLASDGMLYGTTGHSIIRINPTGNVYTKIYDYTTNVTGQGKFEEGANGLLYAVGPGLSAGIIYEFNYTTTTLTELYNLVAATGQDDTGKLLKTSNGKFWGLTRRGGANNNGAIFSFSLPGTYTDLYDFQNWSEGKEPLAGIIKATNGNVYGTTSKGGQFGRGTIFKYNTCTDVLTNVAEFTSTAPSPRTPCVQLTEAPNGKIFGVSSGGGTSNYGTVFSYDTTTNVVSNINSWTSTTSLFTKLVNHSNGLMYATYGSGFAAGDRLYSVNPTTGVYTNVYLFPTSSNGYYASTPILAAPNGKLYGATALGGANAKGTIYSFDPSTSTFAKLFDLTTASGYSLNEMVRMSNGIFYGTSQQGGYYGYGTIFSFNPTGNVFTVLYNFGTVNGSFPKGPMYLDATGKFIGTTSGGGIYSIGVLFSFDPATNAYHKMKDFNTVDGETPLGEFVAVNAGIRVNSSAGISCPGSAVTLTATGAVSYVWQPGGLTGPSVVVNPDSTTTYTCTGTTAMGCTKKETITVEIVTASAGPDQFVCGGNTAAQLNASPLGLINRPYDFTWANNYGDASTDEGFAVATDQAGNVYTTGYFQGNVYFGSYVVTSNGANADIYLIKTNPAGVVQWAVRGGGTGSDAPRDIIVDSNGDIYLTGSIQGVSTFGNLSYTSDNAGQAFIAKFNNAGVGQWIRLVGGSSTDIGQGIEADKFTGDVYMTGQYRNTGVFGSTNITASVGTDYFLVKYNSTGVFQWVRTFTNSNWNDMGNGVSVDNSGNIYVTGYGAGNNLHFGTFTVNCNVLNAFVVKYNAAGTEQWVRTEGGAGQVQGSDIINDLNGDAYVTGYYNGTSTFESNTLTQVGGDDLFYAKYSKNGSLLWVKTAGSAGADWGMRLAMSPLGNTILLTTLVATNCNFGPGYVISNPFASQTTALLTSDTLGNFTWSTSDFSVLVLTYEAVFDPTGRAIYGAGYFDNSTNVGPFNLTPGGGSGSDALLYKMGLPSQLSYSWAPTTNLNFSTIPNPIASPPVTTVYTVSISTGACSVSDAMTVYVNAGVNAGPDVSICNGSQTTLNAIGGGSSYSWSPATGLSATNIQNPVASPSVTTTYTVTISGSCTGTDAVTVTVNPAVAMPGLISGNTSICAGSTTTYSVTAVAGATSYTWTLPGGWSGTSTTNTITTTAGAASGNITVTANNACGSSAAQTLAITVNPLLTLPGAITGTTTICSGTSNTYSINAVAGATSYTWSLPGGWSGSSTTNTITTTASVTSGNITVTANNACGASAAQTMSVTVNPFPTIAGGISGSTAICTGSTTTYSISAVTGAISYTWSLPSGWTGTSTSNSITANDNGTSGTISVTASNGCGTSTAASLLVTVDIIPGTPGAISGPITICSGTANSYSVAAVTGATSYTWSLPAAWTGVSVTNSINTTAGTTSGNISVTANSSCGSSSTQTAAITVNTTPTVSYLQSPATVCINWAPFTLSPGSPAGGTYLGAGVTGNSYNPSLAGAGNQNILYSYTDANNCSASSSQFIYVDACTGISPTETNEIIIYPNPVIAELTIDNGKLIMGEVMFFDVNGKMVFQSEISKRQTTIDVSKFTNGIYFVRLLDKDSNEIHSQTIIKQ